MIALLFVGMALLQVFVLEQDMELDGRRDPIKRAAYVLVFAASWGLYYLAATLIMAYPILFVMIMLYLAAQIL